MGSILTSVAIPSSSGHLFRRTTASGYGGSERSRNPFFIRSSIPSLRKHWDARSEYRVAIPSSSGHLFRPIAFGEAGPVFAHAVAIPSSSGHLFRHQ